MKRIFARLVGPVLGLSLCLLPVSALAAINLPFSTTYNCANQQQGSTSPTWVTCDGMSPYGGWTSSAGSKEQITTSANYPGGGGGGGQRHWIGNGTNNNSGSVSFSFSSSVNEFYVRFYIRHQSGLKLGASNGSHKFMFLVDQCGAPGSGGDCYVLMWPNEMHLNVTGNNYGNNGTWGWNNLYPGGTADGAWHSMEMRFNKSSGIFQWWVDGVLRVDRTGVPYGGTSFGMFSLTSNGVFDTTSCSPGPDCFEDVDDVAVRTTGRIGGIGTTPPAAPQNLQLTP